MPVPDFAAPWWFLGFLAVPLLIWLRRMQQLPTVIFSFGSLLQNAKTGSRWLLQVPFTLRLLALAALFVALAQPRYGVSEQEILNEGIDITIALDVSSSMLAEDFRPNRLEAAKEVATNFLAGRKTDRIGLIIFAGQAFTQAPLTLDYNILKEIIADLTAAEQNWDGTAIGMGLATGVNRLRDAESNERVLILLTDGENNAGQIDPLTAASLASDFAIRVYTIGVGSRGVARVPFTDNSGRRRFGQMRVSIDEQLLQQVATMTGGAYFRATDEKSLQQIFAEIDKMEKKRVKVREFTNFTEHFALFLWIAFGLLMAAMIIQRLWLQPLP
jgi:Ca-activated chloride channel family protein